MQREHGLGGSLDLRAAVDDKDLKDQKRLYHVLRVWIDHMGIRQSELEIRSKTT